MHQGESMWDVYQARLFDLNDSMQMDEKEERNWEIQDMTQELTRTGYCEKEDKTMNIKGGD